MAHAFSHVSLALSLCHRPFLIHLPVSDEGTCRLWDIHLEEQREDRPVESIMFSEDGSLLAIKQPGTLSMWKTSAWERLWSVPCKGRHIFSHDSLQVLVKDYEKYYPHDARSGDALGKVDYTHESMHDHVHISYEEVRQCRTCESSRLENGEFWFTESDKWLWAVEEGVARRLIHIPEYFRGIKAHSGYVAVGTNNGLLVLDTFVTRRYE